jgi:adenylate kinase
MRVVLIGPPGVGKGTQASQLKAQLGVPHVSTGDILREAVQAGTPLGRRVKGFVESGQLVPDEVMGELIGQRLSRQDARVGFVLDGFPRTVEQVGTLDAVLNRLGVALDRVFLFAVPEAEIVRRLAGRRTCPKCGAVYHVDSRPPRSAGVCDNCGSALVQRADDTEDVIRERLKVYAQQTLPVTAAYAGRGLVQQVDGSGEPEAVFARLQAGLAEA